MNRATLCAWHILQARTPGKVLPLTFVTDRPEEHRRVDLERMLRPWSSWAAVERYVSVRTAADVAAAGADAGSDAVLVSLLEDDALGGDLRWACSQRGLAVIEPVYPPAGLQRDFVREVAHHDFELGGKNEWDGSPVQYADFVLRRLSSTHCSIEFPHWAFSSAERSGPPLDVLDIGCGPISILRWGALNGFLQITGVDPLLDMYDVVLARHGLDRLEGVRMAGAVSATAERLPELLEPASFDVVFTNNALDHTQAPAEVMHSIEHVLRLGGRAVIQGATREGTRQHWDQLHKTDLYVEDDTVVYAHRDAPALPLLGSTPGLKLERVVEYTPDWLAFAVLRV
jgi:SAM-dependent methyltransferase